MCAQNHTLGTHAKFRLEIITLNVISSIVDFREIILESSRNVNEKKPWLDNATWAVFQMMLRVQYLLGTW